MDALMRMPTLLYDHDALHPDIQGVCYGSKLLEQTMTHESLNGTTSSVWRGLEVMITVLEFGQ